MIKRLAALGLPFLIFFMSVLIGMDYDQDSLYVSLIFGNEQRDEVQEHRPLTAHFRSIEKEFYRNNATSKVAMPDVTLDAWKLSKDVFIEQKNNHEFSLASIHTILAKIRPLNLQQHIILSHVFRSLDPALRDTEKQAVERVLCRSAARHFQKDCDESYATLKQNNYPLSDQLRRKIIAELVIKKMPEVLSWTFRLFPEIDYISINPSEDFALIEKGGCLASMDSDGIHELPMASGQSLQSKRIYSNNMTLVISTDKHKPSYVAKNGIIEAIDIPGIGIYWPMVISPDKNKCIGYCNDRALFYEAVLLIDQGAAEHKVFEKGIEAPGHNPFTPQFFWAPNSKSVVMQKESFIVFIDTDEGAKKQFKTKEKIHFIEWAPDSSKCAIVTPKTMYITDAEGTLLATIEETIERPKKMLWLDSNKFVVVCSGRVVICDDVVRGECRVIKCESDIFDEFMRSDDKKTVALLFKKKVLLVASDAQDRVIPFKGFQHVPLKERCSPDGSQVVYIKPDYRTNQNVVKFISLDGNHYDIQLDIPGTIESVRWSPDSNYLFVRYEDIAVLLDKGGKIVRSYDNVSNCYWSPFGDAFMLLNEEALYIKSVSGSSLNTVKRTTAWESIQWAHDGSYFSILHEDGVIFVSTQGNVIREISQDELELGALRGLKWIPAYNRFFIFCKNGIAYCEDNGTVRRIETSGLEIRKLTSDGETENHPFLIVFEFTTDVDFLGSSLFLRTKDGCGMVSSQVPERYENITVEELMKIIENNKQ